jgi:hypothetical protein
LKKTPVNLTRAFLQIVDCQYFIFSFAFYQKSLRGTFKKSCDTCFIMVLFKIYYVSAAKNNTEKEYKFFADVQGAAADAFEEARPDMTGDEWNANAFIYVSRAEAEQTLKRSIQAPSVVVYYRKNDKEQFRAAYLKGVGNVAAWKKTFLNIFNGAPKAESGKDDDDNNRNGRGSGTGSGSGYGSGKGLGVRPCIPVLDDVFNKLGFGEIKKYVYGAGAVYFGINAFASERPAKQFINGSLSAALAYAALFNADECTTEEK